MGALTYCIRLERSNTGSSFTRDTDVVKHSRYTGLSSKLTEKLSVKTIVFFIV